MIKRSLASFILRWKSINCTNHTSSRSSNIVIIRNGGAEALELVKIGGNLTWSFYWNIISISWTFLYRYSCGPTVYDVAHLGHARTYVTTDIVRRILIDYCNVDLKFALGITDIDDKIIAKGLEKGFQGPSWHPWKGM